MAAIHVRMEDHVTSIKIRSPALVFPVLAVTDVKVVSSLKLSKIAVRFRVINLCLSGGVFSQVCFFVSLFLCFFVSLFLCFFVSLFLRFFVSSFLRFSASSLLRFFVSSFLCFFVSSFLRFFISSSAVCLTMCSCVCLSVCFFID